MTDVVEIAKERRDRLAAEVGKLDDFIRMAEELLEQSLSTSDRASGTEEDRAADDVAADDEMVAESAELATALRRSAAPKAAAPKSGAADDDDDETGRDGMSARELKAEERVRGSRATVNEPPPTRRRQGMSLFHRPQPL